MLDLRAGSQGGVLVVAVEGLDAVDFDQASARIKELASRAINATARRYRTRASRAIREQVAFPASYLDAKSGGNLSITRFATSTRLQAAIEGRFRPTSLTRFAKSPLVHGAKSPTVEVSPGTRETMKRAFIMRLRNNNYGLAIRLKLGERVENKTQMVPIKNGLYLLYGPSVNQVFRDVAPDLSDEAGAYLEREFNRLAGAFL